MNQKHKANVLKYPPNWREIQEHLVKLKKETFKKVFDSKYQRKEYEKSRKKVLKRWTTEREKHEAAKVEKLAKTSAEIQDAGKKRENGDAVKRQKKTSSQESMKHEKSTIDQRKQKTEIRKKTPVDGKGEAQKKFQSKKPLAETAFSSASKTKNVKNKEQKESEYNKAKPVFSTEFDFKGDSKPIKEICDVHKQTESNGHSQDSKFVLKEENEKDHLNERISDGGIENVDFPTPSESSRVSESEDRTLSKTSDGRKWSNENEEFGSEKDSKENNYSSVSHVEDEASDFFGDENETDVSDSTNEKTDSETENFESLDSSDSDKNFEKGNKKFSDQSNSDETGDSKEEDEN